ncbi:GNAT family N-acetyltransferase [Vibrio alginolyticus]|uniref:GNAT family N-acetyltransferase n=1 Tax=Vibrio alginolyticus TaxID=663 RepID=UPI001BD58326|nr:GNAT family N-acetyltransferase [Vibrio alginolyticus]MBT0082724.1 GNAT family N-acetyltransferase [Vibrio alginolyticus]MBT0105888.1 GNAT family N-acetyltransferase [Vibrio alginolyticus]
MTQISEEDWDLYKSLNQDPAVIKFCFNEPSLEDIGEHFNSRLPDWDITSEHWLCLSITLIETGEKIGVIGLRVLDSETEVGFLIHTRFHGKGYGTESLKALLRWAYKLYDIRLFNAVVTEGNVASEKVLTKCGFSLIKVIPNAYEIGGKLYADHVYHCEDIVL